MNETQLLSILENDARISNHDIALMMNENEEAVARAIKDLEERGVIAGYHTIINKTIDESCTAIIEVNSMPERETGYDRVAAMICKYPEVEAVYLISGRTEFLLKVTGKTMQEISNFVGSKLAPMEGIKGTSTIFVLKNYKRDGVCFNEKKNKQEERLFGNL